MAKRNYISDADRNLFRQSVGAVVKIRHAPVVIRKPRITKSPAARKQAETRSVITEMTSGPLPGKKLEPADRLMFKRSGIQDKLMDKLRRGNMLIERQLDLHGMTVVDAQAALGSFLLHCLRQNIRCARIIHGKGHGSQNRKPVIKNELNHWLRKHPEVLAFCSTPPHDGGSGAVYVLLKNIK